MFYKIVKFLVITQAFFLTACASIPIMSLPKLLSFSLESVDMSEIELAVRLEDNVGIQKGSALVQVDLELAKTGQKLNHGLTLEKLDSNLTPFLQRQNKPGYKIHRFKMTADQADTAQLFREKALAMKVNSKDKIEMSFRARVGFCHFRELPEYEAVSMTFYIKTNPEKDFFTLFKEQELSFEPEEKNKRDKNLKYCD